MIKYLKVSDGNHAALMRLLREWSVDNDRTLSVDEVVGMLLEVVRKPKSVPVREVKSKK